MQSRIVAPLGQEGARLLAVSSEWANAFSHVTHAWRRAPQAISGGPFTYVPLDEIDAYIAGLVADCEEEMLTAQPQAIRNMKDMPNAVLRDTALGSALLTYGLTLATIFILALVIDGLAPNFGGQKDQVQALKVAAYSATAGWVGGIFGLVPALAVIGILFALYGLYLLYLGLPVLMKAPEDKALGYTVVVVIVYIVLFLIVGAIVASLTAPSLLSIRG